MFSFHPTHQSDPEPENAPRKGPRQAPREDLADLGLWIFMASLSVVFLAGVIGYAKVRYDTPDWTGPWADRAPWYAALATLALVAVDWLHGVAKRREIVQDARKPITWAIFLILAYALVQSLQWIELGEKIRTTRRVEFATLGILTSLHALHVFGGFVGTCIVWFRMGKARSPRAPLGSLARLHRYWRFLTVVWIVLMVSLAWG